MSATTSALIKNFNKSLQEITSLLNQPSAIKLLPDVIASLFTIGTALIIAYLMEPWKRFFQKTKLRPVEIVRKFQNFQYLYRLVILNDSDYLAKNVEINTEQVFDYDNTIRDFIPAPLRWTHGSDYPRDIFPHQTVYLDICEVKQEQNKFITLTLPHLAGLDEMLIIKKGRTKLVLKYYQENGQTGIIKLEIKWNGKENFTEEDLPKIKLL